MSLFLKIEALPRRSRNNRRQNPPESVRRPLATLPNPLPDHLERHAKEGDRIKTRIARLEFSAGLATDDAIFDRGVRFRRFRSSISFQWPLV